MDESLSAFCKGFNKAEEIDILPFLAVITNPVGRVDLNPEVSDALSFDFICYQGSACFHMRSKKYCIAKGHSLIVVYKSGLSHIHFSDDFKGHFDVMTRDFARSLVTREKYAVSRFYRNPVVISLDGAQCRQYYHLNEWFKYAIRRRPSRAEEPFRQLCRTVFWVLTNYTKPTNESISSRNDQITEQFMHLLEERDISELNEDLFSSELNISKRCLSRAIKQSTGFTPSEHIMRQKIVSAKELIKSMEINSSLLTIADRLGFSSLSSFSRFFKSHTGMTPCEFRNSER